VHVATVRFAALWKYSETLILQRIALNNS